MSAYIERDLATDFIVQQIGKYTPNFVGPWPPSPFTEEGREWFPMISSIDWGACPSPTHKLKWNSGVPEWVETGVLEKVKSEKIAEINEAKFKADQVSFTFMGKEIQADPHSMLQIQSTNGFILLTGAVPVAAQQWKTLDNTTVAIPDVPTWTQFYGSMVGKGASNFAKAQALKAQVAEATSIAEVNMIKWSL